MVYKSTHDNGWHLIKTPHSSYHCTSMSKPELGNRPWHLLFQILDKETGSLLYYLTSNGDSNVVTIEPRINSEPDRQTVRLDIISVCIIDTVLTSGLLCA